MTKFSERHKRKLKPRKSRKINLALCCILIIVLIPISILVITIVSQQAEQIQNNRIKTKYEAGLVGSISKNWILIGHEFTPEQKQFTYTVISTKPEIPDNLTIQYRIDGEEEFLGSLTRTEPNKYSITLNAEDFGAGVLKLEAVAQSSEVKGRKWTSEPVSINISYGLYIVWTLDWEGSAVTQEQLNLITKISDSHHGVPITNFFNPRKIGVAQESLQSNYVLGRQQKYGDEIGLHLHMWFDLVQAAGVTVRKSPAWSSKNNISDSGYDVPCSAYTYEEFTKMLNWSKQEFAKKGLGTPISFRAGGWYLSLDNVKSLQDAGFKIDSSGRDARFWGTGYIASPWSLGSRTQPYKISKENLNSDYPSPRYDIWEMPNNAADSFWFSAQDMITAMNDNFPNGEPLKERSISIILSHPNTFTMDYPKINAFYIDADSKFYAENKGPIIYTTLAKYYEILTTDPNPKYVD